MSTRAIHEIQSDAIRIVWCQSLDALAGIASRGEFHNGPKIGEPTYVVEFVDVADDADLDRLHLLLRKDAENAVDACDWAHLRAIGEYSEHLIRLKQHREAMAKLPEIAKFASLGGYREAEAR